MSKQTEALKLALEGLEKWHFDKDPRGADQYITAIREALAEQPAQGCEFCSHPLYAGTKCKNCGKPAQQDMPKIGCVNHDCEQCKAQQEPVRVPVTDNTYNYAKSLAEAIFKQHFASDEHYASGRIVWGVNDTVIGILTQIDNMVADMVRRPAQQQEPVAWMWRCKPYCDWPEWSVSLKRPADSGRDGHKRTEGYEDVPLYTSPPASKPWVGLSTDEIYDMYNEPRSDAEMVEFARAIEAKLREKNA